MDLFILFVRLSFSCFFNHMRFGGVTFLDESLYVCESLRAFYRLEKMMVTYRGSGVRTLESACSCLS